jgi:hypothetical protein
MATVLPRPGAGPLGARGTIAAPACIAMGAVFIIVAIWGFITGDHVLMFAVNTPHNVVHLLSGIAALACGLAGERPARAFCLAFAAVYGLVTVLGFLGVDFVVRLLNLNDADNWLHLIITAAFLAGAFIPRNAADARRDAV